MQNTLQSAPPNYGRRIVMYSGGCDFVSSGLSTTSPYDTKSIRFTAPVSGACESFRRFFREDFLTRFCVPPRLRFDNVISCSVELFCSQFCFAGRAFVAQWPGSPTTGKVLLHNSTVLAKNHQTIRPLTEVDKSERSVFSFFFILITVFRRESRRASRQTASSSFAATSG